MVENKRFPVQPPLRTSFLWPAQHTSPRVPQNLLRPTWKGPGMAGVHGVGCGCGDCAGGYMRVDPQAQTSTPSASFTARTFTSLGRTHLGALGMLGAGTEEADAAKLPEWLTIAIGGISVLAGAAAAYHGAKRYDSAFAGVGWYFLGTIAWPIVLPIAFAQGYGKPQ